MRLVIDTDPASSPAWWLVEDDGDDWFPSEESARNAARRVQQQACTAIGP